MSISFSKVDNPRSHLFIKTRKPRVGLSDHQIYLRKKNSRIQRANQIAKEEDKQKFFDWIDEIQDKLKLSSAAFAERITDNGGQASCQTVKLWKRRCGHYPNEKNFKALLKLERESHMEIVDMKFIVRIVGR